MVLLPDHDVVSVPDAWGSFQWLGCMCDTRWQALWWVRLRPGSDDSFKLGACLWVQGIFCAHISLYYCFKCKGLILVWWCTVSLEMFAFARVDVFYSCLEWIETKYCGRDITALLTQSYVYLLSNCFVSNIPLKLPQDNVEHLHCCSYTWTLFHRQNWWFHYPVLQKSRRSLPDPCSFMFSLTYKVAVNLLSLHMALYLSCDLSHNLMQLYSNWLPAHFLCFHQFIKAFCQRLLVDGCVRCICGASIRWLTFIDSPSFTLCIYSFLSSCQISSRKHLHSWFLLW